MPDQILVLYGSYRSYRMGIRLANFVVSTLRSRGADAELIDAKAVSLPMLDRMYKEFAPGMAPPAMEALATKIKEADAFVFVTGGYNWGMQPARTKVMFSAPGTLYIYLVYGLYLMLNVVTGPQRCGSAVLIRSAGEVQGPGRLGGALALTSNLNGKKACPGNGLWFEGGAAAPHRFLVTPRMGVESAGPRWSRRKFRFVLT